MFFTPLLQGAAQQQAGAAGPAAFYIPPKRWSRQPQGPVQVDWGNPISRGLVAAFNFGASNTNLALNIRGAVTNVGVVGSGSTKNGRGLLTSDSLRSINDPTNKIQMASGAITHLGVVLLNSLDSPSGGIFCISDSSLSNASFTLQRNASSTTDLAFWRTAFTIGRNFGGALPKLVDGKPHVWVITSAGLSNTDHRLFIDGIEQVGTIGSTITAPTLADTNLRFFGDRTATTTYNGNGVYVAHLAWNRALTAAEVQQISANPWQIFQPTKAIVGAAIAPTATPYYFPRKKWSRQPQGPVEIDWSNPISRGLVIETGGHRLSNKRLIDGTVNQATNTGTGVSVSHGRYGKALEFNGTQTTGAASFGDASRAEGFSAATWQIIWKAGSGKLFAKWGGTAGNRSWLIETSTSGANLVWVAAEDSVANRTRFDGTGVFITNGWNHAILSWRGGANYFCVINGVQTVLTVTNPDATIQANSTVDAQIGVANDGTPITGSVALSRMWNRGLSLSEMKSLSADPYQILKPTKAIVGAAVSAPSITITRPNSDIVVAGWVGVPDNLNLYANIDEAVPSTTDYILSPDVGSSPGPAIFGLSNILSTGSYDVRFEAKRTQSTGQIRVVLRDSGGVSVGASAWQTLTNAYTTYALTVSTTGTATQGGFEVQP